MGERLLRIKEEIKKEVSYIIQHRVKDPRLGFVSVTDVDLSRDYSYCKIYVSVFGSEEKIKESMQGLEKATGFVRSELAKKIRIRNIPQIAFHYDPSLEYGSKINAILKELDINGGKNSE